MKFSEFTTYLIEAVEARKLSSKELKDSVRDTNLFNLDEELLPKHMRFSDLLHKAHSQKEPVFQESSMMKYGPLLNRMNSAIDKAYLYKQLDAIVL
jgi:tRNA A22 N-methylase